MRLALVLSLTTACVMYADSAPHPITAADPDATLGAPIQIDALTLTPILAGRDAEKVPEMSVLDEAFANGAIRITERDSADVNNLVVINTGNRPVFVLAGEVIIGGKQDRIIGANTVIPAKSSLTIPVFCVEHGRWAGNIKGFSTANALAHGRLRGQANYRDQGAVWSEVSSTNQLRAVENSTDTYRNVARQQNDGTLAKYEQRLSSALAKVPAADRKRMVGFVVAFNGTIATVDQFGSPALFAKLHGKLVKSYLTEAIDVKATAAKPPTKKAIELFMSDSASGTRERTYENDAARTSIQRGSSSANSSVDSGATNVYRNYQRM